MNRRGVDAYDSRRVRHRPKSIVSRDRYVLLHSEPACGAPISPGATSTDESRINCPDCRKEVAK